MFADKKSITQWQEEFLDKGDSGEYLCPIDKTPVEAVRKKGQWFIVGRTEEWLWEVEDLKSVEKAVAQKGASN